MTSEAQELRGYPIPDVINPANTRCIAFTIPDDDAYHRACIAQITLLTKWWNWKRTNPQDAHAKQSAEAFATVLAYSPLDNPIDCALLDGELEMFDCGDVEDCLETSVIVNNIETNINNVSNTVNNHTTEITELTENVTNVIENSTYNEFPPQPTPAGEPDAYCGASWAIAEYLNDFIQDVITDAQTITFNEFITAILGLGGFKASIVKVLWDYLVTLANPNISSEVSDSIEEVANHFYCNNLLVTQASGDIGASETMTSGAIQAYQYAIQALTTAKYSELIYLGSLDDSRNCSGFECQECDNIDLTATNGGFAPFAQIDGTPYGTWSGGWADTKRISSNSRYLTIAKSVNYANIASLEMVYNLSHAVSGTIGEGARLRLMYQGSLVAQINNNSSIAGTGLVWTGSTPNPVDRIEIIFAMQQGKSVLVTALNICEDTPPV